MDKALSYLKMYSVQSGQAAVVNDALVALPGVPGAIIRGTIIVGGVTQTGYGINQVVEGNYTEGGINIGLGSLAILGGITGNKVVEKSTGGIISPESNIWQTETIGHAITKSDGSLAGHVTKTPPQMTKENIRSLNRENESAQILSKSGFNVEQNPIVAGIKDPDYRINGEVFDNYAPKSGNVRNIHSEVKRKVTSGQTTNVVINISDTTVSVPAIQQQLTKWPIMGLDKVIVVDKSGNAIRIK